MHFGCRQNIGGHYSWHLFLSSLSFAVLTFGSEGSVSDALRHHMQIIVATINSVFWFEQQLA